MSLVELHNYRFSQNPQVFATIYPFIPRKSKYIPFDIFDYEALFNDKETVEIIRSGNTIGCFYIESPGMRQLLKRLDVSTYEMLTAASSIIRPGVAESGMMQEFIRRHKNPALRKYLIPQMEEVLGETYGVMIYQEDVIKVAHRIAGLSLEEADLLRRAMSGKMRSRDAMQVIEERFFSSCRKKHLTDYTAKELWRQIESFAGYSFCKAHSASFALLSYQVAYLKAHYPAHFMAAVLSNGGGFYSHAVYIWESKRMGLAVKLPCVNKSMYEYEGHDKTIRIGLMAAKNFSRDAAETIIAERKENGKYLSLEDFIVRTRTGYEETILLIKCGAMDCFKKTRPTLLRLLSIYFKRRRLQDESYNDLFMHETFQLERKVETERDYSIEQKCKLEYEAFGYMVSRHPLQFYNELLEDKSFVHAEDIKKHNGRRIKLLGWYMTSKRIRTKKGDVMKFLSLEDLTGTFEAVIFPNVYMNVAEKTLSMGPYIIEGAVDAENNNNIIVKNLSLASDNSLNLGKNYDTAEDIYNPDHGEFREEDVYLAKQLDTEKMIRSYAS